MKKIFLLFCLLSLLSCSKNDNDNISLGKWEAYEQFSQQFGNLADSSDDHSWVIAPLQYYVYQNEGQIMRFTDIGPIEMDNGTDYIKKIINGRPFGAVYS